MKLAGMPRLYDLILSVGYNCQPALHLRNNQIRSFTGPVDWVITSSIPNLIQLLENRFTNYMKLENLKIIGTVYGHFSAEDLATGVLSFHDFPVPESGAPEIVNYPAYREKLDERIGRFYNVALQSQRALYVREGANREEAMRLREALVKITGGEVYLLVVNLYDGGTVKEVDWHTPYIAAVEIPIEEPAREQGWNEVLSQFRLHAGSSIFP